LQVTNHQPAAFHKGLVCCQASYMFRPNPSIIRQFSSNTSTYKCLQVTIQELVHDKNLTKQ